MRKPPAIIFFRVGFPLTCLALAGRKAPRWLLARIRDSAGPENTPRTSGGACICAVGYTHPPCMPRGRERERRPAGRREKLRVPEKEGVFSYVRHMRALPANCDGSHSSQKRQWTQNAIFPHYLPYTVPGNDYYGTKCSLVILTTRKRDAGLPMGQVSAFEKGRCAQYKKVNHPPPALLRMFSRNLSLGFFSTNAGLCT